jgi:hypothetical protein
MLQMGIVIFLTTGLAANPVPSLEPELTVLLKRHCVKCHGPVKAEAKLNLSTSAGLLRGGEHGVVIRPHDLAGSTLWNRIEADEMPPESPLSSAEKNIIRTWIETGASGLHIAAESAASGDGHWAFQKLATPRPPALEGRTRTHEVIDQFIQVNLIPQNLSLQGEADRYALIRRLSFDLTGLPPTPVEIHEFLEDMSPDAFERLTDRFLASPHYGERLGKLWLDAAGYADSNGYFNADSNRPLAYRYRDYVIRSLNADKPFDRFVREQLAGDELVGWTPESTATPEIIEALVATHYLRNGQDGTGESDGNPEEVRADRYYAIEGTMQIVSTSLLGLTIQCAKCHEHKFEPIPHHEYYEFQAVFAGVFHHENWIKPNERIVLMPTPKEQALWKERVDDAEANSKNAPEKLRGFLTQHRPKGDVLWFDSFDGTAESLLERWSATAPGDDAAGGEPAVALNAERAPSALISNGQLQIRESGNHGDRWLVTKQVFDWTPNEVGDAIQVRFDLLERRIDGNGGDSERIGYFIAAHDFNDNSEIDAGNLLIDGNPSSSHAVSLDYPGTDAKTLGSIGTTAYTSGRNYGIRITCQAEGKYLLEHLVDGLGEEKTLTLTSDQLPDGAFGFEYCCGRSFIVDNVIVENFDHQRDGPALAEFVKQVQPLRHAVDESLNRLLELKNNPPGKIAWAVDLTPTPPAVQWLNRGDYGSPKQTVDAGVFSALADADNTWSERMCSSDQRTTGRRLTWAQWVTHPGSRSSGLLARVQTNRIWQHHFGFGIVETPDNFGISGSPPTHPELLEWLATDFVRANWSVKSLHRRIICSQVYRQTSHASKTALSSDPDGRRYTRAPVRRLDAESIRDAFLLVSNRLDDRLFGPSVPTERTGNGEVIVAESSSGAGRRSLYLNQRRTQVVSLLQTFDFPSIVFNSVRRQPTTIPLQSLIFLNSDFILNRTSEFTNRLLEDTQPNDIRFSSAFLQIWGRPPTDMELTTAKNFFSTQSQERKMTADGVRQAWLDINQMLLAASPAIYIE